MRDAFPVFGSVDSLTYAMETASIHDVPNDVLQKVVESFDTATLTNMLAVNNEWKRMAWTVLWTRLYSHNDQIPDSLHSVTDIDIQRLLKADGPGVVYVKWAMEHFPNLVSMRVPGFIVNVAAVRKLGPSSKVYGHEIFQPVRGCIKPSNGEAPGRLLLAVHAARYNDCSVPPGAFYAENLSSIELPAGLTSIGDGAFSSCRALTSIKLPAGLTSIGDRAFSQCALASIELPAGLQTIGSMAFAGCTSLPLNSVVLPSGLQVGRNAFPNGVLKNETTIS